MGGVGKISELKERSVIVADVLDFQYLASFRNHSASKATGVEN